MAAKMDKMLRTVDANYDKNPDIKWNFTKFLVDKSGNVIHRFEPTDDMVAVARAVDDLFAL